MPGPLLDTSLKRGWRNCATACSKPWLTPKPTIPCCANGQLITAVGGPPRPRRPTPSHAAQVRREFEAYLAQIEHASADAPRLHESSAAIVKVSRSYTPGLFDTYDVPGLPRTNNDHESEFRNLNRRLLRTTGQKGLTRRILQRSVRELLPHPSTLADTTAASPVSPRPTCAKNNSASARIMAASDCVPARPNMP